MSLHIGFYITFENNDEWLTFICPSSWSEEEKDRHFRTEVYKEENGEELRKDEQVAIYEINSAPRYQPGHGDYSVSVKPE